MRKITARCLCIALLWALPPAGASLAEEPAEPPAAVDDAEVHQMPLGSRTRAWLDRQKRGDVASEADAGLTPPADRRARMRYLRSFEHPIPDLFEMDETEGR